MKKKKVNWILYLGLMLLSVGIIFGSLAVKKCNEWFTIISGIGCGAFASVIIALLIEIVNIARKNQNNIPIFESCFGKYYFNFSQLLLSFAIACDKDNKTNVDKQCWFDWLERLAREQISNPTAVNRFIVDKINDIKKEFEKVKESELVLLGLDVIEDTEIILLNEIQLDLSIIEDELKKDKTDWSIIESIMPEVKMHIENSKILRKFNKATYKDSLLDLIFIRCYLKKDIVIPSNKQ